MWTKTNFGKFLKEMGIPDHLTCLLRNLHTGQERTVRTGHGTTDWFHIGKGVYQGCILSPCLLNYMQSRSCEMSVIVKVLEHSLALTFFGIGMKTDFSTPVIPAELFKFAGILSATLSQHHLLGFKIAQLDSITTTSFVRSDAS